MTASIKHLSLRRVGAMGIAALASALLWCCAMLTGCAALPAEVGWGNRIRLSLLSMLVDEELL